MMHPEIQRLMVAEHIETLRRDARRPVRRTQVVREDLTEIELRMCRVGDNQALADLAALNGRELPAGSFVVALADGKLVAAHSIDGGGVLADPFARTLHLRRLLAVRAAQVSAPRGHATLRRLVRRSATA
jgi:hypothetical protein